MFQQPRDDLDVACLCRQRQGCTPLRICSTVTTRSSIHHKGQAWLFVLGRTCSVQGLLQFMKCIQDSYSSQTGRPPGWLPAADGQSCQAPAEPMHLQCESARKPWRKWRCWASAHTPHTLTLSTAGSSNSRLRRLPT